MISDMCKFAGRGLAGALLGSIAALALAASAQAAPRFEVQLAPSASKEPMTGRIIVAVAKRAAPEPRLAIGLAGPAIFAIDVEGLKPGSTATVDATAVGYPMEDLSKLPAGEYHVQALMVRYDKVTRSDGKTLWVPIKQWTPKNSGRIFPTMLPGTPYSAIQKVKVDPASDDVIKLSLTDVIGPAEPLQDTEWLKQISIQSKILTKFWGTPVYLGATVLLPKGFKEHPNARYPIILANSHGERPYSFDPTPPTDMAAYERQKARAKVDNVQTGYEFYQTWNSDNYPRVLVASLYQATPYFVEGYSVDSANNGPYGKAITEELIPAIEKEFRGIGKPYSRITQGASTGGWEALALQLKYPDYFGGAWVFNPDPIDFRRYGLVDIYTADNAHFTPGSEWHEMEVPFRRTVEGMPTATMGQLSRLEAVLGSKGRAGYQLSIWEAAYGPVGEDGYPKPLWDKLTGKIDRSVAEYMRENGYDLTEFSRRNWKTLEPKLDGKLVFIAGEMDNFHLNLGVYGYEDMIKATASPGFKIRFEYGRPKKGHSYHHVDFSEMIREMADHMKKTAPAGEDPARWNY